MLTNNLEMLKKARKEKFAIPAINTQGGNYDIIWAICKAAEELNSPIILAHYTSTGDYSGNDFFANVATWCANKVSVPISIHLDHGDSFKICMEALKLGFSSIMIDGSNLPLVDNAKTTQKVIDVAKCFNVPVEAEIGQLLRLDSKNESENINIANPVEVKEFLNLCNPDALAIGIGNAHGYYKSSPTIRLDILEEVSKFTDIPLVLHGCTGMSEDIIKKSITLGVSKINFGTEVRYRYVEHLKEAIKDDSYQGHSWKISKFANKKLKEDIKKIILLSGSNGKA